MNNQLNRVKEIRRCGDLEVVNDLLGTGKWYIAHEAPGEDGIEYILHRIK
ncbi:hypothetical protein ACFSR7_15400 [Cohnella sp. GCM10020058]